MHMIDPWEFLLSLFQTYRLNQLFPYMCDGAPCYWLESIEIHVKVRFKGVMWPVCRKCAICYSRWVKMQQHTAHFLCYEGLCTTFHLLILSNSISMSLLSWAYVSSLDQRCQINQPAVLMSQCWCFTRRLCCFSYSYECGWPGPLFPKLIAYDRFLT